MSETPQPSDRVAAEPLTPAARAEAYRTARYAVDFGCRTLDEPYAEELAKAYLRITAERDAKDAEIKRLRRAYGTELNEVEQALGRVLRFPAYGPEMFPDGMPDGSVCVGDHTAVSLAMQAAAELDRLQDVIAKARGQVDEALLSLGNDDLVETFLDTLLEILPESEEAR